MLGLSSIFGNDDSNNSNSSESGHTSNLVSSLDSTLGLNAESQHSNSSTDADGSSQHSSSDNTLGFETSTDGLLHSVESAFDLSADHSIS